MAAFPPADFTREDVNAWLREHAPAPAPSDGPQHEAPPVENGPSPVCNACGEVRINVANGPFCKTCKAEIAGATGEQP